MFHCFLQTVQTSCCFQFGTATKTTEKIPDSGKLWGTLLIPSCPHRFWSLPADDLEVQLHDPHLDILSTVPDGCVYCKLCHCTRALNRSSFCPIWNVLFRTASSIGRQQPHHYQNLHTSNSANRDFLNVRPCAQKPISWAAEEIWHCFLGNYPLWELIKRNNSSAVLGWIHTVLLSTNSPQTTLASCCEGL